jgi:hypothetical protein
MTRVGSQRHKKIKSNQSFLSLHSASGHRHFIGIKQTQNQGGMSNFLQYIVVIISDNNFLLLAAERA